MRKKHKRRIVIPRIPAAPIPVTGRVGTIFPRAVSRLPMKLVYHRPKKSHPQKVRSPRIPGTRSLNISEPVGYDYYTSSDFSRDGTVQHSHTNGFTNLGSNFRTGVANPYWKDQCRKGNNATTAMSAQNIFSERSFWSAYTIGKEYTNTGQLFTSWNISASGFLQYGNPQALVSSADPSTVTDVHNRCIRKFIEEVNAARSSENLTGRSIKHFKHDVHSTLHPMSGIQSKISSYLTSLEKVSYGKLKGPSLYSTITQAYLEFKFGVQPFVQDITDIVQDMVIRDRKRNPSVPVQATAHKTYVGSSGILAFGGNDPGFLAPLQPYLTRQITSVYSERMRGAVRTGIDDNGKLGVIQDNRLLPEDWLPTAFSILPYAWMINYFTNIRDIIDAASFRYSNLVWGCFTTQDVTTIIFGDVGFSNPGYVLSPGFNSNYATVTSGGSATFRYTRTSRSLLTPASLIPSFAFSIPTASTPWLNMMAAFSPRIVKVVSKLF